MKFFPESHESSNTPTDQYVDLLTTALVEAIKDPRSEIVDQLSRALSSSQGHRTAENPKSILEAVKHINGEYGKAYLLLQEIGLQLDQTLQLINKSHPCVNFLNIKGNAGMYGQDISRIFGQKIGKRILER